MNGVCSLYSFSVTYYQIRNDPDPAGHKLDVYRPRAKGTYLVVLLVHGGGWMISNKDDVLGIYGYWTIGRCLAERGLHCFGLAVG